MTRGFMKIATLALTGLLVLTLAIAPVQAKDASRGRWLKIRVYDNGASTPTVLVNLPMSVVTAFLSLAAASDTHVKADLPCDDCGKEGSHARDVDLQELIQVLESMGPGQIIEVQKDDQRVSIWIE
jgi:hypothetical protein